MVLRGGIFLLCLFIFSCFGIDQRGGIVKYSGEEVYTGRGRFTVGRLPPSWGRPKLRLKQLVYENNAVGATIVTDALCGPKFQDAPLSRLARDLFYRLKDKRMGDERPLTLDGRSALRLQGSGALDGVPIKMDVVVMKKDFCLYDFVYFAPPETFSKGIGDFEGYFHGLKTR